MGCDVVVGLPFKVLWLLLYLCANDFLCDELYLRTLYVMPVILIVHVRFCISYYCWVVDICCGCYGMWAVRFDVLMSALWHLD